MEGAALDWEPKGLIRLTLRLGVVLPGTGGAARQMVGTAGTRIWSLAEAGLRDQFFPGPETWLEAESLDPAATASMRA